MRALLPARGVLFRDHSLLSVFATPLLSLAPPFHRSALPRSIKTMRGLCLLPDALYTLVVAVLRACGGVSADVPAALPAAMAARHRACTALAAAVREAGYAADMGYNQLLYPNERDT